MDEKHNGMRKTIDELWAMWLKLWSVHGQSHEYYFHSIEIRVNGSNQALRRKYCYNKMFFGLHSTKMWRIMRLHGTDQYKRMIRWKTYDWKKMISF